MPPISGIANYGGTLTLTGSTVSGNTAVAGIGGGVANFFGTLTLTNSTISGNAAGSNGGGVHNRFGVSLSITNSTISGNSASSGGGVSSRAGTLISNSTISGNSADNKGGGVYNFFFGTVTLSNSIISGNTAPSSAEILNDEGSFTDAYGIIRYSTINANNYNLFGHDGLTNAQAFFNFTPGPTDITATSDGTTPTALSDIVLADNTGVPVLVKNGGFTKVITLVPGSLAIDAVPGNACPPPDTDQRGYPRPADGDSSRTAGCDIGAYEFGVDLLNGSVTFVPIPGTFSTTTGAGAKGCPVSFEGGAFSFEARLTKRAISFSFTHVGVQVITLTSGNELLLDDGTTGGVGATIPVPPEGDYTDEILNLGEQVDVPFTICLQDLQSFAFFVDVFGQVDVGTTPLHAHLGDEEGSPSTRRLFKDVQGTAKYGKVKHKKGAPAFKLGFDPQALQPLTSTEIKRLAPSQDQKHGGK